MVTADDLRELGQQLRVDSVRAAAAANSGHPTSSMSAADLIAVLAANHLRYDFANPDHPNNDHLIFSKGHASPLLYALYKLCGAIDDAELLSFRKFGSRMEGHPTPEIPWVDVATGSLGQGLPIAVGVAIAARDLERLPYRVWVLCGDSEMAEGSMWEAFEAAGVRGLDNLCAIVDVNRLGQRGETMHGWNLDAYRARAEAFGWHVVTVDGHDVAAIDAAYAEAVATKGKPTCIVARTMKGRGVAAVEDQLDKHGKPLDDADAAIAELGGERDIRIDVTKPEAGSPHRFPSGKLALPTYEIGAKVATRKAYGDALAALAVAHPEVVAIDGEVSNSTFSETVEKVAPERFLEMYIAEQQMVATAIGLQVQGWKPFVATFAAFLARAYDFVRMAQISRATLSLCGSHAGVSIGEDGPSQMALEDLAEFRAIHGSTVLYPSDANQTAQLLASLVDQPGISYLRTTRGNTPVIYAAGERFAIGGSRVVRGGDAGDQVTVVGAGITLHEAVAAADALADEGIAARVIDLYSVKPIDADTLRAAATATAGRVIVAEDHWPEGGLGDAVLDALADSGIALRLVKLAPRHLPGSGTPAELLADAGIDAAAIADAARRLVKG